MRTSSKLALKQQECYSVRIYYNMRSLQGSACLLTKFVADAPTTTMQRLKGLMTVRTAAIVDCGTA